MSCGGRGDIRKLLENLGHISGKVGWKGIAGSIDGRGSDRKGRKYGKGRRRDGGKKDGASEKKKTIVGLSVFRKSAQRIG